MSAADRGDHALLHHGRPPEALDALRATFLAGAVVALARGEPDDAVRMVLTFAAVAFLRVLDLPRIFDVGMMVGLALQGWGNVLDLFDRWAWWDVVVHFGLPLSLSPTLYVLLARLEVVPDLHGVRPRHHALGMLIITFALGMAVGGLYEIYEWLVDHAFGGRLRTGYGDTIADLLDDALGSLTGGALLVWWATVGLGSRPRRRARRR
jgi:hypothetical protein